MSNGTINWDILEQAVDSPLLSIYSKEGMAEIRSLERQGYVHLRQQRVVISAAGLNALTLHGIEVKTPAPVDLAAQLAAAQRELAAANERITGLEAALKPFAEAAEDSMVCHVPEYRPLMVYGRDAYDEIDAGGVDVLSVYHLRAARDALKAGQS